MPFVNGTGCNALCLDAAGRVSGGTSTSGVNFGTLAGSSLTRHVALPDHGVGLDGIEFLQTLGRTPASGSLLEGTPVQRIPARRNPGSPLWSFPGSVSGSLPFLREMENFR
ncbi:hypothetical protein F2Q68_00030828 [Brassica cretica]|uniref:Uncharacterized protein n=1 Tax=Brassica cretica TaxID=69181 RepID=A0A8S9GAS4_BRACR|nr:hypothetical protein F2Q68_00030828 [Brassica cretica]